MTIVEPVPVVEALAIPMSDGVSLAALRVPAARASAPTVVLLTPYGKETQTEQLIRFGFGGPDHHVLVVDVRGLGGSDGDWDGPLSPREIADGVEVLAWAATQDFSDGRTALVGASYGGINTLLIAAQRPSSLRCAIAIVPPVDFYRDMWRRGGIPSHMGWGLNVAYSNERRPHVAKRVLRDFYVDATAAAFDNVRHRDRSVDGHFDQIAAPVLLIGGWYDHLLRGISRAFAGIRTPKRLLIGNWGHRIDSPVAADEVTGWLTYWLSGEGTDPTASPNVRLQCVGSDAWTSHERWSNATDVTFERWQPIVAPVTVDVALSEGPSTTPSPVPPQEDMRSYSGMHLWGETWTADTTPVAAPTKYRGAVALRLALVSTEATDIDVHARLSIVDADGEVHQVTEGRLRASHRTVDLQRSHLTNDGEIAIPWHPHDRVEPIPLGEPIALDVEINPINLELAEGDALRLGLMLIRADEIVRATEATLLPDSHVLLPRAE